MGEFGDDAGIGQYTFVSQRGSSVIDYVIMAVNLFPIISYFVVHDLYTCFSNVPIQVDLKVRYHSQPSGNENIKIDINL